MYFEEKRVHWLNNPVSREIDAQVREMPSRPRFVLALVSYDISQDRRNRTVLDAFLAQRFRELPLVVAGRNITVTYLGFAVTEAGVMADFMKRLEAARFEVCVIYIDGEPSLHARSLKKSEGG